MRDALIVGGGPAGAAAAITLARAGCAVTVLEREREAAHKVCGDFLSGEAIAILERLGVDVEALGAVGIECVRLSRGERVSCAPLPFRAVSLTRKAMDEALLRCAEASGARVVRGIACERLERAGVRWIAIAGGEVFGSDAVMLATGKHDLRGFARAQGEQNDLVGFKMYWRLTAEQHEALGHAVELHLFPDGYAGLQAVEDGVANLCCAVRAGSLRKGADERWAELLERMGAASALLRARLEGATPLLERPLAIAPVPYGMVQAETADGLWRVGDQAAVIPSFTGDGVSMALWSGEQAALSLLAGWGAREFQQGNADAVRAQVSFATRLSRWMTTEVGASAAAMGFAVWPGMLGSIARRTRLRQASLG